MPSVSELSNVCLSCAICICNSVTSFFMEASRSPIQASSADTSSASASLCSQVAFISKHSCSTLLRAASVSLCSSSRRCRAVATAAMSALRARSRCCSAVISALSSCCAWLCCSSTPWRIPSMEGPPRSPCLPVPGALARPCRRLSMERLRPTVVELSSSAAPTREVAAAGIHHAHPGGRCRDVIRSPSLVNLPLPALAWLFLATCRSSVASG
mmetsp:Transcript_5901/g.12965  ORF Transcript_5901/g.12965 Transcript_5901/m.12965 type:complete len:213 (-) Transcript_5901:26-664(-)